MPCRARPWLSLLVALAVGTLVGGCTVRRETLVPVIDASTVHLALDRSGPWRETEAEVVPNLQPSASLARAEPAPAPPMTLSAKPLPVPRARGLGETTAKGQRPGKPLAQVARERFLDHPTEIEAEQVTLYAPPEILAEGLLTGADLSEPSPGRRIAVGDARLALRELTLRAERLTLRARAGSPDIQITARGNVRFVSRQRDQVVREQGLKSLILTNDQLLPLR